MNVFKILGEEVEKATGLKCVYHQNNIESDQICIRIGQIEATEIPGKYIVKGTFSCQTTSMHGWEVLTTLLQMGLEYGGSRAVSDFQMDNGFNVMSVDFSMFVNDEEPRKFKIKKVEGFE